MNTTVEGRTCTKNYRINNLNKDRSDDIPDSYITNNDNERICLSIVDDFQSHFLEQNAHLRNNSYIAVANEYSILKCVCTTLKPTLLPNPSLYDVGTCSEFVAEYMGFEPLENPCIPPTYLPSPTQTLSWKVGDCFDISILLASFLIGAGYDAYVVYGIAPKWICTRDRSVFSSLGMGHSSSNTTHSLERSLESAEDVIRTLYKLENYDEKLDGDDEKYFCHSSKIFEEDDELYRKRIHCWVAVKAGLRSPPGTMDFFIEPSTGIRYPCNDAHPYMKIFALWNHQNYWMNKSPDDVSMNFNLGSSDQWHAIFFNKELSSRGEITDKLRKPFDPPFSWVEPLNIPQEDIDFRYPPNGQRVVLQHKTKIENFSDGIHKQALMKRITKYKDEKMMEIHSCEERFGKMRTDNLVRRIKLLEINSFQEDYASKHSYSVQKWIENCGKKRIIHFTEKGRSDGLKSHIEHFGMSIVHLYCGRPDGLYERTTFLKGFNGSKEERNRSFILLSTDGTQNSIVVKIVEKYMIPEKVIDNERIIASRCFNLEEKCFSTEYLKQDGGIEREVVNQSKKRTQRSLSTQDGHDVMNTEKATIAALRSVMQDMADLVRMRKREEDTLRIDYSRRKDCTSTSTSNAEQQEISTTKKDKSTPNHLHYLAPFLLHVKDVENITTKEALQIKNACLETYKERVFQRADIMQHRLNEESAKLTSLQENYQLNLNKSEVIESNFIETSSELTFRIKILEKRLHDHEESFMEKYKALESKLMTDLNLLKNCDE